MVAKAPKKPRGIALRPELWARVDAVAQAQQRSANQVIEMVLELHLPVARDLPKSLETEHVTWSTDDAFDAD